MPPSAQVGAQVGAQGGDAQAAQDEASGGDGGGDGTGDEAAAGGPAEAGPDAEVVQGSGHEQADWGVAAVIRAAGIPFAGVDESEVLSFLPMLFFEGERFFWRGIGGGVHLWKGKDIELNLMARAPFLDFPAEAQGQTRANTVDIGFQAAYSKGDFWMQGEWLTDRGGRQQVNARLGAHQNLGRFELIPSVTTRYKTSEFSDFYFALTDLTGESAGAGWDIKANVLTRYHVWSDLYLIGSAGYTLFDQETRNLSTIEGPGEAEVMFGFGFFQHRNNPNFLGYSRESAGPAREISTPAYLRVAHGWATPSDLIDVLGFSSQSDQFDNQLSSIFYGYPLTDELFGVPLDIYLTPGFVWHHPSEVQSEAQEYVLAIKGYYTMRWPTTWRFGLAEGVSWISDVTYIERESLDEGDTPSNLMNYLDVSFDLNVGDLVRYEPFEHLWLGWSIHHRSSIFESASQFGRLKAGSNYNTVYLQYDFL